MTKEEFAALLIKNGYKVTMENGCVIATGARSVWKSVQKIAADVGFDGSFGWRMNEAKPE